MILIATQCFPPDRGGIEILMGGLADALAASGREVAVYADRAHANTNEIAAKYPIKRFGGLKPIRRRVKAFAIGRAAARVEGVFADSWKSVELLPDLGAPIAVLAHGMEFPASPSVAKRARIARALAKARTVIAASTYTASLAKSYLGAATRLVVINPPIGAMDEPSSAALAGVREIIAGRSPVVLTLARLEPRKGVDAIIRALPEILVQHRRAVYVVAGAGDDRARLEQLARDVGVMGSVHFAGPVDAQTKAALFACADVFAMPSRRERDSVEGFGIVYLEAGWYGAPSLAGREGGAVDAVLDGRTGLICDGADQADVARKLLTLVGDDALRRRLGAAAKERARGPAQWSNAISAYLDALK